jgi:hypothetical protein
MALFVASLAACCTLQLMQSCPKSCCFVFSTPQAVSPRVVPLYVFCLFTTVQRLARSRSACAPSPDVQLCCFASHNFCPHGLRLCACSVAAFGEVKKRVRTTAGGSTGSVRNLRIREDTAKYLLNLDTNSAHYDPKSRSMREDPNPNRVSTRRPGARAVALGALGVGSDTVLCLVGCAQFRYAGECCVPGGTALEWRVLQSPARHPPYLLHEGGPQPKQGEAATRCKWGVSFMPHGNGSATVLVLVLWCLV